ncbi:MAG: 23S rRNA (uracil(1939)-C(5))-methyltransferase RlmD [Hormoscilla sp. GUM202]|nr:23S rRNA (uracil(1939)-C(5))-methyltransferase RlmD [Hormoscilla sp. GUM202]
MSLPSRQRQGGCSRKRQGDLVECTVTDLSVRGEGVGRFGQRVVFVPDTLPGDRVLVRLVRVKRQYAHGKLHQLLVPSGDRVRPSCIVADKCGGCQWQHIDYSYQLQAKRNLVVQSLQRIGGISQAKVDPVLTADAPLKYRNKVTYPLGLSSIGQVQAGYYQKGSHKLVNLNQCPVQDSRLHPLLAEVKLDMQRLGWPVYSDFSVVSGSTHPVVSHPAHNIGGCSGNESPQTVGRHRGQLRHLALRIGRRTGEILLTLVVIDGNLPGIKQQAQEWLQRYPGLVGVCLNYNPDRTNVIFGKETRCLAGQAFLREEFAGLQFQLRPDTFFQVNTEAAEALLHIIVEELQLQGHELLVDAYCGIGTFTLPDSRRVGQANVLRTRYANGLELQPEAIAQAEINVKLNQIENVQFQVGKVEKLLPQLEVMPDIVLLDPPRQGCERAARALRDRAVLSTLLEMKPQRLVYVSCKPSTLARDLQVLCADGGYQLSRVQPADFFPQTSHVEGAAFLDLCNVGRAECAARTLRGRL